MRKIAILTILILTCSLSVSTIYSQTMICRTGHVNVASANALTNIEADNYQVQSSLNIETGEVSFIGLTKSFTLESGALDKAFNSQYVDVTGYSKFQFDGEVLNLEDINFSKPSEYVFNVSGLLKIGAEIRKTAVIGTLIVNPNMSVQAYSDFTITIEKENADQINQLLKERLGGSINMSSLGVSRDINLSVVFNYK